VYEDFKEMRRENNLYTVLMILEPADASWRDKHRNVAEVTRVISTAGWAKTALRKGLSGWDSIAILSWCPQTPGAGDDIAAGVENLHKL
jgi:hypothetical protein